jgi:23S rRNA C2498 (ribose-2'-O)-methylase RlmM
MRKTLNAKGIAHQIRVKQLYHDREEVTVLLARKR